MGFPSARESWQSGAKEYYSHTATKLTQVIYWTEQNRWLLNKKRESSGLGRRTGLYKVFEA